MGKILTDEERDFLTRPFDSEDSSAEDSSAEDLKEPKISKGEKDMSVTQKSSIKIGQPNTEFKEVFEQAMKGELPGDPPEKKTRLHRRRAPHVLRALAKRRSMKQYNEDAPKEERIEKAEALAGDILEKTIGARFRKIIGEYKGVFAENAENLQELLKDDAAIDLMAFGLKQLCVASPEDISRTSIQRSESPSAESLILRIEIAERMKTSFAEAAKAIRGYAKNPGNANIRETLMSGAKSIGELSKKLSADSRIVRLFSLVVQGPKDIPEQSGEPAYLRAPNLFVNVMDWDLSRARARQKMPQDKNPTKAATAQDEETIFDLTDEISMEAILANEEGVAQYVNPYTGEPETEGQHVIRNAIAQIKHEAEEMQEIEEASRTFAAQSAKKEATPTEETIFDLTDMVEEEKPQTATTEGEKFTPSEIVRGMEAARAERGESKKSLLRRTASAAKDVIGAGAGLAGATIAGPGPSILGFFRKAAELTERMLLRPECRRLSDNGPTYTAG